jgi:hypothetical protein
VHADGYVFDSQAEHRRYEQLKLLQQAGEIQALRVHPRYKLMDAFDRHGQHYRPVHYEADFAYTELGKHGDVYVVEDVKGARTRVFQLKAKLFALYYPLLHLRVVDAKEV